MANIRNLKDTDRFIVYMHTNKINGKHYVGITKRTLRERVNDGYAGCRHFNSAIEKYGWDNFYSEILEEGLTCDEACEKEKYYIKKYDSIENGYNLEDGGIYSTMHPETIELIRKKMIGNTLSKGQVYSDKAKKRVSDGLNKFYSDKERSAEARRKQSEANKGKIVSVETRRKQSEALKGRKFSDETIEKMRLAALNRSPEVGKKISEAKRGIPMSDENKRKISEANKGKKRTPEQIERYRQAALNRSKEHQDKINKALKERRIVHG